MGPTKGLEFLTGYILEKALSVDNLFVIVAVFRYFRVDPDHQPHVLKWGILGALFLRLAFILAGTALVRRFRWTFLVFGVLLVYTGLKMAFGEEKEIDGAKNPALLFLRRFLPIETTGSPGTFLVRRPAGWAGTPLLAALVVIEASDIIFAADSIPAVLAITTDPFIVYTSNIFAVLGLRSLYYLLAHMADRFSRLKYGISAVLVLTGLKMLLADVVHVPVAAALAAVVAILAASVLASPARRAA
jgi:tellurite resistance protein TerC